jgi:hypothetical protein
MDRNEQTAGERWEFRCEGASSGWVWRHRSRDGRIVASSMCTFHSLDEAVTDAVRGGFAYAVARSG